MQQLVALSAGARVPALRVMLARQARCFGFGSHMSDNDPEVMEKEKQRHLKGQTISHIKQVPGWSEKLASDAEAVVKAEHDCPDCPIDEMQRQTVETLQEQQAQQEQQGTTAASKPAPLVTSTAELHRINAETVPPRPPPGSVQA